MDHLLKTKKIYKKLKKQEIHDIFIKINQIMFFFNMTWLMETKKKGLAEELHKTVITKFEKRKVHVSFIDNIWVMCS